MKKSIIVTLFLICTLWMIGCTQKPQQAQVIQLLPEGNVVNVEISTLPEGYNYSFSGETARSIEDYLSGLSLESDFEENPNEYAGMTYVISLGYESGNVLTVYHFGNMFIRSENDSWYKMTYDEASRLDTLLNELSK